MKILVFSDSHGDNMLMGRVIDKFKDEIGAVLFAGDNVEDFTDFHYIYPNVKFFCVIGNCDFNTGIPTERTFQLGGNRIFLTHGHRFSVKSGHKRIMREALSIGANICIYGHSHVPAAFFEQNIYFLNPGSISEPRSTDYPTFAVMDIEPEGVKLKIIGVNKDGFLTHIALD